MPFQSRRAPPPRMVNIPSWSSTAPSWILSLSFFMTREVISASSQEQGSVLAMKEAIAEPTHTLAEILRTDPGIVDDYRHGPKQVTPGEKFRGPGVMLKWYALHAQDEPVPNEIDRLARAYLSRNGIEAKGLGFVILHRCG